MAYKSINPFTLKEEAVFDFISDIVLEEKLRLSEKRFGEWSKTSIADRAEILNKAADLLEKEEEKHASFITWEMGKPISQ
ncbi:MAG: aldehyde dehydrogenase family protein, partial [Bacteroidales bacterium]|nr:aldehyde dehydrogenase family protein [Bacteroidales bacterium]